MKLLRYALPLILFITFFSSVLYNTSSAEELNMKKYSTPDQLTKVPYKKVSFENLAIQKNNNKQATQSTTFVTFDSLGNAYSYLFQDDNRPFVYDKIGKRYLTIKRGYNVDESQGTNSKNNVFYRASYDNCVSWDPKIKLLYDKSVNLWGGRYPSCYGFQYEKTDTAIAYVVAAVDEANNKWYPPFDGIVLSQDDAGTAIPQSGNLIYQGKSYSWDLNSRMLAGVEDQASGKWYVICVSSVTSVAQELTEASNIAIRKTNDYSAWNPMTIPDAWRSSSWHDLASTDAATSRYNQVVDLKMDAQDNMYLAAYGNFTAGEGQGPTNPNRVGISRSADYGNTWDIFDLMPYDVLAGYAASNGCSADSIRIGYDSKGFTVLDNGDFSFVVQTVMYDRTAAHPDSILLQIAEIYKTNGNWYMKKVTDLSGAYMTYADVKNWDATAGDSVRTNPSDIELQIARTFDGNTLIAKWVDLVGYDKTAGTFTTTDIFVSTRQVNSLSWSAPQNVTASDEIDRVTLLPDLIPNNLTNIPIIKNYSITGPGATDRENQFYAAVPQYLQAGHFNAIVGVDENTDNNIKLSLNITPNPVINHTLISYSLPSSSSVSVDLYNVMGQLVKNINSGSEFLGPHSIVFRTDELSSGTYYCTLTANGEKVTKIINVIR